MSVLYTEADLEVLDFVAGVKSEYFPGLSFEPPIQIEVLMASDPKTGVGVRLHGHACAAKIKLLRPEDRAAGRGDKYTDDGTPDVRIIIDRDRWNDLSERQRTALLHHELSHIQPVRNKKDGSLRYDDFGRVRLKLRLDDWLLTGFAETAAIFGSDALEVQSLAKVNKALKAKKTLFDAPVDAESDDSDESKPAKGRRKKSESVDEGAAA